MAGQLPKLPTFLDRTKEQVDADEKYQELRRASFTRARLTEAERLVGRGSLLEETWRANLETARGKNAEARVLAENNLADALAMQGRYAEASELHHDRHRRKHFRDVLKAIEKPDGEMCNCKPKWAELNGVGIEIPNTHISRMVFSPKHGDVVGLEVCGCGAMNARPLTGTHATTRANRGRPDTEILKVERA